MSLRCLLIPLATLLGCGDVTPDDAGGADEGPPASPNIVFLLADDLRFDHLSYAGHPVVQTPAIDALARRGTRFDSAYVTTAICSVSRASILSGQYGRRHGIWGFERGFAATAFAKTYPAVLRAGGYHTGFIGKWGVGPTEPVADRFDFFRGFDGQGTYHHVDAEGDYQHLTERIGLQIDSFFATVPPAGSSRPWHLSVSFKAPHALDAAPPTPSEQFPAAPRYDMFYADAEWPRPPSAQPRCADHFPDSFGPDNVARRRYARRFATPELYDATLRGYSRLIQGIDDVVARLVARLDALGMSDDTVIVFTSDHGFYLGEYGFAGKWYGSEVAIRIPLVVVDPRRPGGQVDAYALNIDLAPTMIDLAGLEIPSAMQGRSLTPLLGGAPAPPDWRSGFFYEHLWPGDLYDAYPIPSTEGLVTQREKYMRYFRGEAPARGGIMFEELYRRDGSDPHEIVNLVGASAEPMDAWAALTDSARAATH